MDFIDLFQQVQKIIHLLAGDITKPLTDMEGQLEGGAADMPQQDQQVVGVD